MMDDDVNSEAVEAEGNGRPAGPTHSGDESRPKVWPPVVALLVLAVIIWALLEQIAPPDAFGG